MKNKKIKILSVLILFIFIMVILCNSSFASFVPNFNGFENVNLAGNTTNTIYTVFGAVINILTIIGAGIALVILIWLGIQYIIGSVEKKAELKKQSQTYVFGACILFAASTILKLAYTFIENSINKAV